MPQPLLSMTAPPPIMSVPPPTVQHIINTSSYAPQPHMYGHAPVSMAHAGVPPPPPQGQPQAIHIMPPVSGVPPPVHQNQQFVINQQPGWPQSMAPVSSHQQHLSQPAMHGAPPMEYRSGSGGTTYQQIQHPIMTASAYNNNSMAMYPSQPVPFPMQPMENANPNMIRPGQKRKMMDEGGDGGSLPNKNGHG